MLIPLGNNQKRNIIKNTLNKIKDSRKKPLVSFDNTVPAAKYMEKLPALFKLLQSFKK